MKINIVTKIAAFATVAAATLAVSGSAHAATSSATLTVQNFTSVSATGSAAMSPSISDIQAGNVSQTGAITLNVVTNNAEGCKITVSAAAGDASTSKIAAEDIYLKSSTSGTDSAFGSYAPLSTSAQDLWNTSSTVINGTDVVVDVRFGNLSAYPAVGGAQKQYTNTITFTAVANS